jgi:FkbM family methyltransferase
MHIPPFHDVHWKTLQLLQAGNLHVHFSQWGEDVVLWHYLMRQRGGFYVDVGAHHPHRLSNTALLHHYNGWTGINIEPDARLMAAFLEVRPNDINLCCGVGAENGVKRMAIFEDGAVNSFDEAAVEIQISRAGKKLSEWRDIPVRTLTSVLDEHLPVGRTIDLLNVDAEGWDLVVLKSNDWDRYRPGIILVEDHKMNLAKVSDNETFKYLSGYGYRLVAQTLATSIYKREP